MMQPTQMAPPPMDQQQPQQPQQYQEGPPPPQQWPAMMGPPQPQYQQHAYQAAPPPQAMWNHHPSQIPPPQPAAQQPQMHQMHQPMVQYQHAQAQPQSADEIRTLWIGDLQYWMDENFLSNCFVSTGELVSTKVIRNKQTGESERYGFIEFATHATAEHVLQTYNGQLMPNSEKIFRLKWAAAGERRGDDGPDYTVFVGDLAADVTDYLLQETFKTHYPSVKGAKIVTDMTTGRSTGYGFVRFGDLSEQTRAMTEMDGMYCSSRQMRVGPATTKKNIGSQPNVNKASYQSTQGTDSENDPNNTTIFVGGLDPAVTDDLLRQVFSPYGDLVHVKIPANKRCGFVQFVNRACAEEALNKLNGTLLGNQNIQLSWGRTPNEQASFMLEPARPRPEGLTQQKQKMSTSTSPSTLPSTDAPCWSAVLQKKPSPKPQEPISSKVFGNCGSSNSKGISVAVVDANAIIHGDKLVGVADKFVTISDVLDEVRDPVSRQRLAVLPLSVETMDPSAESIKKVVKFARETGDLQTLSDVDLKLIALTYMLESQIHGTSHLRDSPPPLNVVNVKTLPEAQMPGWGSNVPNLAEWEAIEQLSEGGLDKKSRILPVKDLNDNGVPDDGSVAEGRDEDDTDHTAGRTRRFAFPKKEIKIDGKKMVADGIDASLGEDTDNIDDWRPAVSRSTHRRYLRRKARRELAKGLEEYDQEDDHPCEEASRNTSVTEGDDVQSEGKADDVGSVAYRECEDEQTAKVDDLVGENLAEHHISSALEHVKLGTNVSDPSEEVKENAGLHAETGSDHKLIVECVPPEADDNTNEFDNLEISSQTYGSIDTSSVGDASSEQSWMLRSLSDSTVACVTSDYAMQNVILQIGLRLLAPGGMQIRQLHRWVLKCHACNKVTQEIGRIFCPKCGNGGTLRKVSITVGENGLVLAARRQRIILRGTKFSLPLPQGGRDAITKNLILREDQLPHKLLYPKAKKKPTNQDQDFICTDDIFSHSGEKRAPLKPPVRKALAVFSGRRNPNDNHFSRAQH